VLVINAVILQTTLAQAMVQVEQLEAIGKCVHERKLACFLPIIGIEATAFLSFDVGWSCVLVVGYSLLPRFVSAEQRKALDAFVPSARYVALLSLLYTAHSQHLLSSCTNMVLLFSRLFLYYVFHFVFSILSLRVFVPVSPGYVA
jgi:hypothetical protein